MNLIQILVAGMSTEFSNKLVTELFTFNRRGYRIALHHTTKDFRIEVYEVADNGDETFIGYDGDESFNEDMQDMISARRDEFTNQAMDGFWNRMEL